MKKSLILLVFIVLVLSGCKKNLIEEVDYSSISNEWDIYSLKLGDSPGDVEDEFGEPTKKEEKKYQYTQKDTTFVFNDDDKLAFLSTTDDQFRTNEDTHVGQNVYDLLANTGRIVIQEYPTNNKNIRVVYNYDGSQQKANFYLLENNVIRKMAVGNEPLQKMFYDIQGLKAPDTLQTNEEFISSSSIVEGQINYEKNRQIFLGNDFNQYVAMGVIKGVPVVMGVEKSKLERRVGSGSLTHVDQDGTTTYYYRHLSAFYKIKDNVVTAVYFPLDLTLVNVKEKMKNYPLSSSTTNGITNYTYPLEGGYELIFNSKPNDDQKIVGVELVSQK